MLSTQKNPNTPVSDWTPESWRSRPALHQPTYACSQEHRQALHVLARSPALVSANKVLQLKALIAQAQDGKRFILQGAIAPNRSRNVPVRQWPASSRYCSR